VTGDVPADVGCPGDIDADLLCLYPRRRLAPRGPPFPLERQRGGIDLFQDAAKLADGLQRRQRMGANRSRSDDIVIDIAAGCEQALGKAIKIPGTGAAAAVPC
jgi:hypothetical protein